MQQPPISFAYFGRFHGAAGTFSPGEPPRRAYQHTAKRIAFRALTSGKAAARLVHILGPVPHEDASAGEHNAICGWLVADPIENVTAHRGEHIGEGGPWRLANAIIPGSAHAVQALTWIALSAIVLHWRKKFFASFRAFSQSWRGLAVSRNSHYCPTNCIFPRYSGVQV
jgi:hypothetical protein